MKKGFTLIELLAVIVILAIIALIAVPIVLNIIEESKNNTTLRSAEMYLDAVEMSIATSTINNKKIKDGTYDILENSNICLEYTDNKCTNELKVEVDGTIPSIGSTITISNGQITNTSLLLNDKTIVKNNKGQLVYYISPCKKITGDKTTPGSKYECEVKPGTKYNFFVLSQNNDGTTNLIMERNINSDGTVATAAITEGSVYSMVAWYIDTYSNSYGPVTAMNFLYNATKDWINIPNIQMNYRDEGNVGNYGYGGIITSNNITKISTRDATEVKVLDNQEGYINLKARMPYLSEVNDYNGSNGYLYEYLDGASWNYEASSKPKNNISKIYGYWTLSSLNDRQSEAVHVDCLGIISYKGTDGSLGRGIRPVITVRL